MNERIKALDSRIAEGKAKLSELSRAGEDAWESLREGVESAWDSLKSAVSDVVAKFKDYSRLISACSGGRLSPGLVDSKS
jgi:hypothetical protein